MNFDALRKKLLPHKGKIAAGIGLFVIVLLFAFFTPWNRALAADMWFDAGATIVRGETPVLGLTLATPGPLDTRLEAGFNLIGSSTYPEKTGRENPVQIAVHAAIVDGFGPVDVGIGIAVLQNEDAYNSGKVQFMPLLRWWLWNDRVLLTYRHFSNSGSVKPNTGRDFVMVGWRF